MLKILFTIALILNINCIVLSQSGWIWQNPLPQGNNMLNLQFVNSNTPYALCFNSVMKSTNAGSNWSIYYTNHSQNNTSLHFINETTGFIVSDTGIVMKTVNGGANWSVMSNFNQKKFHKIYFTDVNTGYLLRYNDTYGYRGTTLYRTTSGGQNWSVLINDTSFALRVIEFLNSQTGFIGGSGDLTLNTYHAKIFRSTNNGSNWDSLHTLFNCRITGIQYRNNTLFAYGNRAYPSSRGMFLSTNLGASWISSEISRDVVDISYVDPNNIYATATNSGVYLYKSINNGFNWINVGSDIKSNEIELINPTTGISVGGSGQVHRTTNSGVNWIRTTSTIFDNYLWTVEFVNSSTGFVGGSNSLLKTTNSGNNWFFIPRIPGDQIEFTDENTGYAANVDTMYKTTNCGLNWINLNYGQPGQINEISFVNNNTGFYIGKYNILKKTTDGGNSWTLITGYGGGYQETMYFANENLGFIRRNDNSLGWGISRTTNSGLNWDFQPVPFYDYYIWDIHFINENTGFYTTQNRIFKTTNNGDNWYVALHFEIYNYPVDFNSIQFLDNSVGYAAATGGKVFKTTDSGETWKLHNSISNYGFSDMYFTDINTGYLVGGGGIILKTTNGCGDPIGIQPISSSIPESFMLYQNYPNPFNPVTKIKFAIPHGASGRNEITTLKIYDILGKEVAIPLNEILSPGEYEIEWDAREYPSGVYFCRMGHGSNVFTVRIVLIK